MSLPPASDLESRVTDTAPTPSVAPARPDSFRVPPHEWKFDRGQVVVHVKTGNRYVITGHAYTEADLHPVYVYMPATASYSEHPLLWTRQKHVFEDGRFTSV